MEGRNSDSSFTSALWVGVFDRDISSVQNLGFSPCRSL